MLQKNLPYYMVVFVSIATNTDHEGYSAMAQRMVDLSKEQEDFLGIESVRDDMGNGITICYWKDMQSIQKWKQNIEHLEAQRKGKETWYERYEVRIAKVEREYSSQ